MERLFLHMTEVRWSAVQGLRSHSAGGDFPAAVETQEGSGTEGWQKQLGCQAEKDCLEAAEKAKGG
jgi:hypothetical protein